MGKEGRKERLGLLRFCLESLLVSSCRMAQCRERKGERRREIPAAQFSSTLMEESGDEERRWRDQTMPTFFLFCPLYFCPAGATFEYIREKTRNWPRRHHHLLPCSFFICGAADRSGRSKRRSCCCCCWGTIIDLTKYSFLGREKVKTLSQKRGGG